MAPRRNESHAPSIFDGAGCRKDRGKHGHRAGHRRPEDIEEKVKEEEEKEEEVTGDQEHIQEKHSGNDLGNCQSRRPVWVFCQLFRVIFQHTLGGVYSESKEHSIYSTT